MGKLLREFNLLVCLLLGVGLTACGGSDSGSGAADSGEVSDGAVVEGGSSENTDSADDTISPTPGVDQVAPIVSALEGTWTSGCFLFEGNGNEQSRLLTLAVEGSTSVSTMFSYSDLNCSVPVIPSIENGVAIESSMVNSVEFPEQTVTTSLGEASFINFTTVSMTVDGVTEILGSSTRFTIFLITDDGQLFFGAGGASNSPESRPQTLDLFFPLIRL